MSCTTFQLYRGSLWALCNFSATWERIWMGVNNSFLRGSLLRMSSYDTATGIKEHVTGSVSANTYGKSTYT